MSANSKKTKHYTKGSIQVWDFIIDQEMGYLEGNVIKYVCRYRYKGQLAADLAKAKHYLEKLEEVQRERNPEEFKRGS